MHGRVALITGSARGIGLAIARRLAQLGAHSVVTDIDGEQAAAAASDLRQEGYLASAARMDVSSEKDIARAVAEIREVAGPHPILVNNAGIPAHSPALDMSIETWNRNIAIMLAGPLLLARALAPAMIAAKCGRIINMGSLMAFMAFGQDASYCAAKAGLLGLSRSLAADLAPHRICVNTICPGNILTGLLEETAIRIEARDGLAPGSFLASRHKDIPLGRLGEPADVAKLAAFLASDEADCITGQAIHVNVGLYLNPPQHAAVFCVDEKTAIQALDRLDPLLPLSPGRAERHGFEYQRHGTLSLYAAFNTKTGQVLGKTAARHTSAEFVAFLTDLIVNQPRRTEIHVIADNLSAHKTGLVQDFLTAHPRVHLHFTPTYSSWLNQVELWFAKIERDVIARGVFTSVADLRKKLMRYIRKYNEAPKTVKWKYFDPTRRIAPSTSVVTVH